MGTALTIHRTEYTAEELRAIAGRCKDGAQVRRVLAIALILGGYSRGEAAALNGMDRQTRDGRELLLCEAGRLAERLESRPE